MVLSKKQRQEKQKKEAEKRKRNAHKTVQRTESITQPPLNKTLAPDSTTIKPFFFENNLVLGGVGVIVTAFGFLVPSIIYSGILLFVGWVMIVWAFCRHNFFEHRTKRIQQFANFFIAITLAVAFSSAWFFLQPAPPDNKLVGYLVPADVPSPPLPESCHNVSDNATVVYLGNSAAWTTFPAYDVITINDERVLSIEKSVSGLRISAIFRGKNGEELAKITDNVFQTVSNNDFAAQSPDPYTIQVIDKRGKDAKLLLYVKYLNRSAIRVMGTFAYPNRKPIVINEDNLIGSNIYQNFCVGNNFQGGFVFR